MVFRVDGVTNPATGSPFIILKSADDDELRVNAEELAKRAFAVLKASEGQHLSKEVVSALQELASALGVEMKISEPEVSDAASADAATDKSEASENKSVASDQSVDSSGEAAPQDADAEPKAASDSEPEKTVSSDSAPEAEKTELDIGKLVEKAVEEALKKAGTAFADSIQSRQPKVESVRKSKSSGVSFENIIFGK